MRKCPLCDKEADSQHHIKPHSEGGTDDLRNLVWLCKSCHDRVEGMPFTPDLIELERRKLKGHSATSGETYVFMVHDDYIVFSGIRVNSRLVPFGIILPKEQALIDVQVTMDLNSGVPEKPLSAVPKINPMPNKGRPRKTITSYLAKILDEDISLGEKAKLTGLSKTTVHRYIKEKRTGYIAL